MFFLSFAEEIDKNREGLFTREEFNELKGIVRDLTKSIQELTEAQRRNEVSIKELIEVQKRSEERFAKLIERMDRLEERLEEISSSVGYSLEKQF
ncbi:MAG: hypothetical protein NZ900_01430 [Synergistetes bacterium]|nr:hypothetical protein [Synergistota bacterium]MDW8191588.1 hypothetical protein [Synergistota bacterium]